MYLQYLRATGGEGLAYIPVEDVLFFRAGEGYTEVVTGGCVHRIRTPLAELLSLLDPERFWQVHRTSIVNASRIEAVGREAKDRLTLKLQGHAEPIAVGRAFHGLFCEAQEQ